MADAALMRRMHQGAELIAAAARFHSGWSHRIPASIYVEDAPALEGCYVFAGGHPAPHAITFEAPNAPFWRHPLWATGPREDWDWYPQIPPRRFLKPAAETEAGHAVRVVAQVVHDWAKLFGFHTE